MRIVVKTLVVLVSVLNLYAQPTFIEANKAPGAFSRMGFSVRGMAMGNVGAALSTGELSPLYNPAASVYQKGNSFNTGYSIMSMDRSLNILSFTRRFDFFSDADSLNPNAEPRSTAGTSIGLINAGVSNIDQRDAHGFKLDELSTSENLFYFSFANKFSRKLSIGFLARFYYYSLYEDITTTSFGFDIGSLYVINDNFTVGLTLSDINTKYKWDTTPLYSTDGLNTTDKFPLRKVLAVNYQATNKTYIVGVEYVSDNMGTSFVRAGGEYIILEKFVVRAGLDNVVFSSNEIPALPTAGFGYTDDLIGLATTVQYAFIGEPYTPAGRHSIGIVVNF